MPIGSLRLAAGTRWGAANGLSPLGRGDPVVVMPLNLRGRVARDWPQRGDARAAVEVDVHGKRVIVARRQVSRDPLRSAG